MGEDVPQSLKSCCALKWPFGHVGAFICPQCGATSEPMSPEKFRAGLIAIRDMYTTADQMPRGHDAEPVPMP